MAGKKNKYLIDINYKHSMNAFYEFYGETIPYSELEQISYIDFKYMFFELINSDVKFRKHERNGKILTLKVELSEKDHDKFVKTNNENEFKFVHDFEISKIYLFKEEE